MTEDRIVELSIDECELVAGGGGYINASGRSGYLEGGG